MNILVIHNKYKIRGGEDSVFENEVLLLREMGHSVHTYLRDNSEIDSLSFIDKLTLPLSSIFSLKSYRDILKILDREEIEIIHIHNTLLRVSPSIFYAALAKGVPVVQTLHNYRMVCPGGLFLRDGRICEDCLEKGLFSGVKHKCYRASRSQSFVVATMLCIHRFLGIYKKIDYICLSKFAQVKIFQENGSSHNIKQWPPASDRIHIKPNFVFPPIVSEPSKKAGYIFVGRLDKSKGIYKIADTFGDMPELQLKIIGDGPEKTSFILHLASLKAAGIEYLGQLEHQEVLKHIASSRFLVMASQWYEGLPMVILEALSLGVPAIVPALGGLTEVVRDGENGLLYDPESPCGLADALLRSQAITPSNYGIISQNAHSAYLERYSPESNYDMLMEIYKSICGRKNNSSR